MKMNNVKTKDPVYISTLQAATFNCETNRTHLLLAAMLKDQMDGALVGHGGVHRDEIRAAARRVVKLLAIYHQAHESRRDAAFVLNQLLESQHAEVLQ